MDSMKRNGLLVGAGFLLGTVGIKALTSPAAKKHCVQGVAQGLRAKSCYEDIVEQAKAQVVGITLGTGDLSSLVGLRRMSVSLMQRMDVSFAQVVGINSALLAAGIGGVITPQTSLLLRNASTVALSLRSARRFGCGEAAEG